MKREISRRLRNRSIPFAIAMILSLFGVMFVFPARYDIDSDWYISMARGNHDTVVQPHANRVLHPFLAGELHQHFSVQIETAFDLLRWIFGGLFLTGLCLFSVQHSRLGYVATILLVGTPILLLIFEQEYLPDLSHAAAIVFFFYFLSKKNYYITTILLGISMAFRESTVLLGMSLSMVFLFSNKKAHGVGWMFLTLVFYVFVAQILNTGAANIHGVPDPVYMVAKVPYNTAKNILGLQLTLDSDSEYWRVDCEPTRKFALPISFGSTEWIGFCGWNAYFPIHTLRDYLTKFGGLPIMLFFLYRSKKRVVYEIWVYTAALYGVLSFLIAPMLGASVPRLLAYSWPAFWLVVPAILSAHFALDEEDIRYLLLYSWFLSWAPLVLDLALSSTVILGVTIAFVAIMCHIQVVSRIKQQVGSEQLISSRLKWRAS